MKQHTAQPDLTKNPQWVFDTTLEFCLLINMPTPEAIEYAKAAAAKVAKGVEA